MRCQARTHGLEAGGRGGAGGTTMVASAVLSAHVVAERRDQERHLIDTVDDVAGGILLRGRPGRGFGVHGVSHGV